jgi:hypothetical protein
MNTKQAKTLETVATKNWIEWKLGHRIDGELEFKVQELGDKVYVFASNVDSIQWFQKHVMIQMLIGIRGGVNQLKLVS